MKKLLSAILTLALILGAVPTVAAEAVAPTPPEWINAEDYLIFPGDEVYLPDNWAKVVALREEARNGALLPDDDSKNWAEGSAGMCYETALVRIKYALNAGEGTQERRMGFYSAGRAFSAAESEWEKTNGKEKNELYYRLNLEKLRAWAIFSATYVSDWKMSLGDTLDALEMSLDDFFAGQYMYLTTAQTREAIKKDVETNIRLLVDGVTLTLDVPPEVKNQRTMVPVRAVGEAIGADVEWVQEEQKVVMTRAGSTVTMTLDSTTATVDGKAVEMDVAPYAVDGRTLLPARYVAEFFGQKVDWDGKNRRVLITEDKSVAEGSNLEQWVQAMGLIYVYRVYTGKEDHPTTIRFGITRRTAKNVQERRESLSENWGGNSREHIISLVENMTAHGHNDSFLAAAQDANSLTESEMAYLISISSETDQYMWPYTKSLSEKWGDKGILAWDLSRMGAMVQWGYHAGRLTYAEALALAEPAARLTAENFSSWEEFYENYLDGYNWWARNNVVGMDPWETERGPLCRKMLENPILDDTLFQTGVIPLPEQNG